MKNLEYIIVHCSDSTWGSAREIRKWHTDKGWKDIGYHFVILNGKILPDFEIPFLDGSIELGRPLDGDQFVEDNEVGAHTLGYNDKSLGICGVGKSSWSAHQIGALVGLVRELMLRFNIPVKNLMGHHETESGKREGKTCPNLNMNAFRKLLEGG